MVVRLTAEESISDEVIVKGCFDAETKEARTSHWKQPFLYSRKRGTGDLPGSTLALYDRPLPRHTALPVRRVELAQDAAQMLGVGSRESSSRVIKTQTGPE